jgi:hypothetical protein
MTMERRAGWGRQRPGSTFLAAVLSIALVGFPASAHAVPDPVPCVPIPAVSDHCPTWEGLYGSGTDRQTANDLVVSEDGSAVYVVGQVMNAVTANRDLAVVAYSSSTGEQLWMSTYDGPAGYADEATRVAVGPQGRIYVTGRSQTTTDGNAGNEVLTICFEPNGVRRWVSRYTAEGIDDQPTGLAVSADSPGVAGGLVFVGSTSSRREGVDAVGRVAVTIAYDADSGAQVWTSAYSAFTPPGGGGLNLSSEVAVSPDGARVYTTGMSLVEWIGDTSTGITAVYGHVTRALDARTGTTEWSAQHQLPYQYPPPADLAVSPDGSSIVIAAVSKASQDAAEDDITTIAYEAATGGTRWVSRIPGTPAAMSCIDGRSIGFDAEVGGCNDGATAVAISPQGTHAYVTGTIRSGDAEARNYVTASYDLATGARSWLATYDGSSKRLDGATDMAVGQDGSIYVTGSSGSVGADYYAVQSTLGYASDDYATIAYSPTGDRLWISRVDGPAGYSDAARAIATSPDGSQVFVTGSMATSDTSDTSRVGVYGTAFGTLGYPA